MADQDQTDWKAIALALGQRVNFAIQQCSCKSQGMLDLKTGKVTGWRAYMVEALEMVPGVQVDREILATLDLPPAKRRKAQAEIRAARKAHAGEQHE